MRLSAKADYALRAAIELAANPEAHMKMDRIAAAQEIPVRFLEHILLELKHAQIVESRRGAEGGYRLARAPEELSSPTSSAPWKAPLRTCEAFDRRCSSTPARQSRCAMSSSRSARACAPCSST